MSEPSVIRYNWTENGWNLVPEDTDGETEVVERMVHIDDLYPKGPEDYDPNCCCAMCLDISIALGRKKEVDMYRNLRREGKGKIARLVWKKRKQVDVIVTNAIADSLFFADPDPNAPKSGLAALIAD